MKEYVLVNRHISQVLESSSNFEEYCSRLIQDDYCPVGGIVVVKDQLVQTFWRPPCAIRDAIEKELQQKESEHGKR